jgi:hypothetical protein
MFQYGFTPPTGPQITQSGVNSGYNTFLDDDITLADNVVATINTGLNTFQDNIQTFVRNFNKQWHEQYYLNSKDGSEADTRDFEFVLPVSHLSDYFDQNRHIVPSDQITIEFIRESDTGKIFSGVGSDVVISNFSMSLFWAVAEPSNEIQQQISQVLNSGMTFAKKFRAWSVEEDTLTASTSKTYNKIIKQISKECNAVLVLTRNVPSNADDNLLVNKSLSATRLHTFSNASVSLGSEVIYNEPLTSTDTFKLYAHYLQLCDISDEPLLSYQQFRDHYRIMCFDLSKLPNHKNVGRNANLKIRFDYTTGSDSVDIYYVTGDVRDVMFRGVGGVLRCETVDGDF